MTQLTFSSAHVPVPDSVLNPRSAPEAWNILRLSVANIERLVHENRLSEVPEQASLCSPALRTLARLAEATPRQREVAIETLRVASSIDSLAQACIAGDRASVDPDLGKLHAALGTLANGTDAQVVNAEIFFCQMHPDVTSADGKTLCPKCGMALMPRRIPYSFVYTAPPGEPSLRLTAEADTPPIAGHLLHAKMRLTWRDGSSVGPGDLLVTHTQRIHLLIIDSTLTDYHHEHPIATDVPGEFAFTFTPSLTGSYRIYADVVPALTGIQEYIPAEIPGDTFENVGDLPAAQSENAFVGHAAGLSFQLTSDQPSQLPLRAGQVSTLHIAVRNAEGAPFARLEPVMNAFAHLVGFYDDHRTVVHLHPAGPEVTDPAARGGPELDFRFYPPKAGYLRLFCQVLVNGQTIFVPFGVTVAP